MYNRIKETLLANVLMTIVILCMIGCTNKKENTQPSSQDIREYRTRRYLERVSAEAYLAIDKAQEEYDEACKEKHIDDSVAVKKAISKIEDAKHNARVVASYMRILNAPADERSKEDSMILVKVYSICRGMSNRGWGENISERLVRQMESDKE